MDFNEYQRHALRTSPNAALGKHEEQLTMTALGLAGEAGEVVDLVKKRVFHGHDLPQDKLRKELGDVLWYVAVMASLSGIDLESVATANVDKLRARYPDGFSEEASRGRADK